MPRIFTGIALAGAIVAASIASANAQVYYGQGLPPGSYQQSCTNITFNGSTMSASCTNGAGQHIYSSINLNNCNGSNIRNNNGYLVCNGGYNNGYNGYNNGYGNNRGRHRGWRHHDRDRDDQGDRDDNRENDSGYGSGPNNGYGYGGYGYGYGAGLPAGSFKASCTNIRMNGPTLSATCTSANGQRINSSINLNRCGGAPVRNNNGYLRC